MHFRLLLFVAVWCLARAGWFGKSPSQPKIPTQPDVNPVASDPLSEDLARDEILALKRMVSTFKKMAFDAKAESAALKRKQISVEESLERLRSVDVEEVTRKIAQRFADDHESVVQQMKEDFEREKMELRQQLIANFEREKNELQQQLNATFMEEIEAVRGALLEELDLIRASSFDDVEQLKELLRREQAVAAESIAELENTKKVCAESAKVRIWCFSSLLNILPTRCELRRTLMNCDE